MIDLRGRVHAVSLIAAVLVIVLGGPLRGTSAGGGPADDEIFLVAKKAFADGFYDVALRYLDQFLSAHPSSSRAVQARLLQGQCYFFKGRYVKAFDVFQGLTEEKAYRDAVLFWLGETYFKGGDLKAAETHYRKVIEEHPDSPYLPQARYALGWTALKKKDYAAALKEFQAMVRGFPDHRLVEDAFYRIGECLFRLERYREAAARFLAYLRRYPQSPRKAEALFYAGECHYYLEDYLSAVTYYAKAADAAGEHRLIFLAKVSMGWSYLRLQRYDLAEGQFQEAASLAQEYDLPRVDLDLGRASLYSEKKEYPRALEAYDALIRDHPDSPRLVEARLGRANVLYAMKKYPEAVADYRWVVDHAGSADAADVLEKAYYGLAWTYLKSGDVDRAVATFREISSRTSNVTVKVSALTQIGDALQEAGRLGEAVDVYDQVLRDYPDTLYSDYAQFRQAVALLQLDRLDAAVLALQSLKAHFPRSKYVTEAWYYLGLAHYKKEEWASAIGYLRDYLDDAGEEAVLAAQARYLLAISEFQAGDYGAALADCRRLLARPGVGKSLSQYAMLYAGRSQIRLGREAAGIRQLAELLIRYPDCEAAQETLVFLGDRALTKGDYETAAKYYRQFLIKFPGSPKAPAVSYELGEARLALDDLEGALQAFYACRKASDPDLAGKANMAIGEVFSRKLDPETALETYRYIAQTLPAFRRDAFMKIAEIHKARQDYPAAIEAYEKALAAPARGDGVSDSEIHFVIGDCQELLGNWEKAVDSYIKIPYLSGERSSWTVKAYLRIARLYEDRERWAEARRAYEKVVASGAPEAKHAQERLDRIAHMTRSSPRKGTED